MIYIVDSYAWVEYFIGSKKGEVLKKLFLDGKNQFLTVECCLAEIKGWAIKNNKNFDKLYKIIRANSNLSGITEYNWIDAAIERAEQRKTRKNFGLIDAIILIKQKELNCKIISGDRHFEDMRNVVFLEEDA